MTMALTNFPWRHKFTTRADAAATLAQALSAFQGLPGALVIAPPGGSFVLAREVAARLGSELLCAEPQGPFPEVEGRCVIVIHDALSQSARALQTIVALHPRRPAVIVIATPVSSARVRHLIRPCVSRFVCLAAVDEIGVVDHWFTDEVDPTAGMNWGTEARNEEHSTTLGMPMRHGERRLSA